MRCQVSGIRYQVKDVYCKNGILIKSDMDLSEEQIEEILRLAKQYEGPRHALVIEVYPEDLSSGDRAEEGV